MDARRKACAALAIGLALVAGRAAADEPAVSAQEAAAFYAFFDGLGYPDLGKAPFVRVFTGNTYRDEEGSERTWTTEGFLVDERDGKFVVFSPGLERTTFEGSEPDVAEAKRVRHEPLDLVAFARAGLSTMRAVPGPVEWHQDRALDPFRAHTWAWPNQAFRLAVLARACAARGAGDVGLDLLRLARREAEDEERNGPPLRGIRRSLLAEARVVAIERLPDRDATLADVRDALATVLRASPEDEKPAGLAEDVAILERMVREGAAPKDDPVARLREVKGRRWAGYYGTGLEGPESPSSPLQQTVERGSAAVPALLAALTDRSFTRSVLVYETGHGQMRWTTVPYRVGDAAADALDEIAGGAFREDDGAAWSLRGWETPKREALVARAKAWWADAQRRGIASTLVEAVALADDRAARVALRLAEAYPKEALAALPAAIAAAKRPQVAADLVEALGSVAGGPTTDALLALLRSSRSPRVRLALAQALWARERREGIDAVLGEWRDPSPAVAAPESPPDHFLPDDPGFRMDLVRFLAESGDAAVFRTLGTGLEKAALHDRLLVLQQFLRPTERALAPDARRALEDLLGAQVGETAEVGGVQMSDGDGEIDTRIGHMAARAMGAQWPHLYAYDRAASGRVREGQRREIENAWRKRRGLPAKPAPPDRPRPAPPPAGEVEALLDRLAKAGDAEREQIEAAVVRLGPGALPIVVARGEARLAARVASIVTEVNLGGVEPPTTWKEPFEALRGRPFDGRAFAALVLHLTREAPEGIDGMHLNVERSDDGGGTVVSVAFLAARPKEETEAGWGRSGPQVWVADRSRGGKSGSMTGDYGTTEAAWMDDAEDVDKAFLAPPERSVRLLFQIRGRK